MTIERLADVADARKRAAERLDEYPRNAFDTLLGVTATLTLLLTIMAIERNTPPPA